MNDSHLSLGRTMAFVHVSRIDRVIRQVLFRLMIEIMQTSIKKFQTQNILCSVLSLFSQIIWILLLLFETIFLCTYWSHMYFACLFLLIATRLVARDFFIKTKCPVLSVRYESCRYNKLTMCLFLLLSVNQRKDNAFSILFPLLDGKHVDGDIVDMFKLHDLL